MTRAGHVPALLPMKKILCYYYPDFADFEITLACHKLRQVGHRQILGVSLDGQTVTSESGLHYQPDLDLAQALALDEVEALLIPGGPIRQPPQAILDLIRQLHARSTLIAAICNGPHHLARAGLLDTHRYTTSFSPEAAIRKGIEDPFPRAQCTDARVERDGNLITAQGRAFVDFSVALWDALGIYARPQDMLDLQADIRG